MNRSFLLLLFCGLSLGLSANGKEQVLVQINRQVYINGSYLKYNVYLSNPAKPAADLSSVIYFEIVNATNEAALKWKSRINGHKLTGQILLPETIENGVYYLKAYTNVMRSYQTNEIGMVPFIIQRIYEDPVDSVKISFPDVIESQAISGIELPVEIKVTDEYTNITIPVSNQLMGANLSVSVSEQSPFDQLFKSAAMPKTTAQDQLVPCSGEYYTESGDMAVSGLILHKQTRKPLADKLIYLTSQSNGLDFKYTRTNANGQFCFLIDSVFDNRNILIQLVNEGLTNDSVEWLVDQKDFGWKAIHDNPSTISDVIQKEYLYKMQKRELVQRIFNPEKNTPQISSSTVPQMAMFDKPKFSIEPRDYELLNNFQELCDNILTSVRYKRENEKPRIGITNPKQETVFGNVLMCVNGVPVNNMAYFDTLNSDDIDRVDIYNDLILLGDLTFEGIVAIYTPQKANYSKIIQNPYYSFNNVFYTSTPSVLTTTPSPSVSAEVYWNPDISTQNNPVNITIKHPDIGKEFYLNIQGITPEGKMIYYKSNLKLK